MLGCTQSGSEAGVPVLHSIIPDSHSSVVWVKPTFLLRTFGMVGFATLHPPYYLGSAIYFSAMTNSRNGNYQICVINGI
jgi:hypothetical protein